MDDPLKQLKIVFAVVLVGLVSIVDIDFEMSLTKNIREGIYAAAADKTAAAQLEK